MNGDPKIGEEDERTRLSKGLQAQRYLSARLDPRIGEEFYLCLSDLRRAAGEFATDETLRILDFGCGCSPYKGLFPNSNYFRADYLDTGKLDFRIEPGIPIKSESDSFDLILSTQVLEHVDDPVFYLRECFRLLKAGGVLILSTHGTFPDHGCPYDFRRWTLDGLEYDLQQAGFAVDTSYKLTTGPRAVLAFLEQYSEALVAPKASTFGFIIGLFRRLIRQRRAAFHVWADENFHSCRVAPGSAGASFYIGLIVKARKVKRSNSE